MEIMSWVARSRDGRAPAVGAFLSQKAMRGTLKQQTVKRSLGDLDGM